MRCSFLLFCVFYNFVAMNSKLWKYLLQPASVILLLAVLGLLYYGLNDSAPWLLLLLLVLTCLLAVIVARIFFSWWMARKTSSGEEENTVEDPLAITLKGSTKKNLSVRPEHIVYMEAEGNYVSVYYLLDAEVKNKLLRITISQMETLLQDWPTLIRCHRTFIVNTRQISRVKGNVQGYRLCIHRIQKTIPVSRSYVKDFSSCFGFSPELF